MHIKKATTSVKFVFYFSSIMDPYPKSDMQQIHYSADSKDHSTRAVYLVTDPPIHQRLILKVLCMPTANIDEIQQCISEYEIGKKLSALCPIICKPIDMQKYEDPVNMLVSVEILYEYCGPDLSKLIGVKLKPVEILHIARETLKGFSYLESNKTMHSDIKPQNIVMDDLTGAIKIIDFGGSKQFLHNTLTKMSMSNLAKIGAFTPSYCPPEIFHAPESVVLNKYDVYCWGMTLYQIMTGKSNDILAKEVKMKVPGGDYREFQNIVNEWEKVNGEFMITVLKKIVGLCLVFKPNERPSFNEMYGVFREKECEQWKRENGKDWGSGA